MTQTQYVALLRGINVGGRNIIKMAELRTCLQEAGFADVATYIQSGNVLLTSRMRAAGHLADEMAATLAERFGYAAMVLVRSHAQMRAVLDQAPEWLGADPAAYRDDCIFLADPLTADEALAQLSAREGVDRAATGPGVLYWSRLGNRAAQSRLSRITALPLYASVTIRNWHTTTKLATLMDQRAAAD